MLQSGPFSMEAAMIDRTTKFMLGLIAAGLWANVWMHTLKTTPAYTLGNEFFLQSISSDISALAGGFCRNRKLC
jgi:hypothetical protein